jgi:hypothetical protein
VTVALAAGLALALLASAALNGSYLLQHAGSAEAPAISVREPLRTVRSLFRSRVWLVGLALGLTGWALHVGALSLAPLSLVQAFVAGGLAFAAPVAARVFGAHLSRGEQIGVGLMVLALVGLALGAHAPHVATVPVRGTLEFLAASAIAAAALAALPASTRRAHALGLAGGILYGAADVAVKAATVASHAGVFTLAVGGWLLLVAAFSAGAFFCFQRGLQIGPALPVIALMTAATNLASIFAGVAVFGDALGPGRGLVVLHVISFVVVGIAAWLLAPAQAGLEAGPKAAERGRIGPARAPLAAPE